MNLGITKKINLVLGLKILFMSKKLDKKKYFDNLTLVPIDKELINKNLLNKNEKNGLMITTKKYLNVLNMQ